MKLQILAACAALVSLSAGSALAADSITAKLASPVAAPTKFIAGGAMFKCDADACVAWLRAVEAQVLACAEAVPRDRA